MFGIAKGDTKMIGTANLKAQVEEGAAAREAGAESWENPYSFITDAGVCVGRGLQAGASMTPARAAILREAEQEASMLRRCGYPDAMVAPEYCIGGEIGPDKFMIKTVCVYVGEYQPETITWIIRKAMGK
jgi:hypothetical protein